MKQPVTPEWAAEISSATKNINAAMVNLARVKRSRTPTYYRLAWCRDTLEQLLKISQKAKQ